MLWDALSYVAGALLLLLLVYGVVRVGSFAYFRTKLAHMRSVLKELNGGDRDG